jgi:hypothetical protein
MIGCAQLQENREASASRRCNELSHDLAAATRSHMSKQLPCWLQQGIDGVVSRNLPAKGPATVTAETTKT